MSKLLIAGTVAYDSIETPFEKVDYTLGGAAVYIALAASQYPVDAAIVSVIGSDFEQDHLNLLGNKGINLEGVETIQDQKTFFWSGLYKNDMNSRETLTTELHALAHFNPVVPESYKSPKIAVLGNLDPTVQMSVLNQLSHKPELVILDTMNYWMIHTLDKLDAIIAKTDLLSINDEEARMLSGEYSLVKAAKNILKRGPKYLVIKKGEHGALLFHENEVFFAPALPLEEVYDPTGAGDTFAGGLAGYLSQIKNINFEHIKNAVVHGSNLASFCVEQMGVSRMVNLEREELVQRLRYFKKLTQFDIHLES